MAAYKIKVLGLLLNVHLDSPFGIAAVSYTGCCVRAGGGQKLSSTVPPWGRPIESNAIPDRDSFSILLQASLLVAAHSVTALFCIFPVLVARNIFPISDESPSL